MQQDVQTANKGFKGISVVTNNPLTLKRADVDRMFKVEVATWEKYQVLKMMNGVKDVIDNVSNGNINFEAMLNIFIVVLTIIKELVDIMINVVGGIINRMISVEFIHWFPEVKSKALKGLFKLLFGIIINIT